MRRFRSGLAVSQALAASTTTRAFTKWDLPSLSKYSTPVALPRASVSTRLTVALVVMRNFPVPIAMGSSEVVDWKAAPMEQPRPQGVA